MIQPLLRELSETTPQVTDHRVGNQVQRRIQTVSDCRVRQMRDRGLRAIPAKLDKSP